MGSERGDRLPHPRDAGMGLPEPCFHGKQAVLGLTIHGHCLQCGHSESAAGEGILFESR